jgi:glutathione S-transferase
VLHWDAHQVAETLPIAGYLSRRFGHYAGLSDEGIARREMISSAAYLGLLRPLAEIVWQHGAPPSEADWKAWFTRSKELVLERLPRFERLLAASGGAFFSGEIPSAADWFVFEGIDACRALLGAPANESLERCPRLQKLGLTLLVRPHLRAYLNAGRRPLAFTGNPGELDVRPRLLAATPCPDTDRR